MGQDSSKSKTNNNGYNGSGSLTNKQNSNSLYINRNLDEDDIDIRGERMTKKRKLNNNFDSEQSFHPSVTYDYLEYNENACDILEDYSKCIVNFDPFLSYSQLTILYVYIVSLTELKFLRYYFDMRSEELPKSKSINELLHVHLPSFNL